MVGPLEETTNAHLYDIERQEVVWDVISELTDTAHEPDAQAATPHRDLS